jgi:hypothetical protein
MGWSPEPVRLVPSPKLCDLIRRSRQQLRVGADTEDA